MILGRCTKKRDENESVDKGRSKLKLQRVEVNRGDGER